MNITITIDGVSKNYVLTPQNATITRTMVGYNVTATVMHKSSNGLALIERTVYISGNTISENSINKAFAPDIVGDITKTDKVQVLQGVSPEIFTDIGICLPDRPEYPSVRARKEARANK